ncbi:MAG: glycosyltransferase family 2 protein [Vicinamibacterales bacterium]
MPASPASIAIVIVTYNSRTEIGNCLDSLIGRRSPHDTRIVVVDNASTDGTAAFVRERWADVHVVDAGANVGFARANNLGIAATTSDLVLLLNPDTVVPDGAIQTLASALAAHPDAAIAGPRLVDDRHLPELSFGPPISPWGELRQKLLLALYGRGLGSAVRYVNRRTREAGPRAWVSGACLLARRADLDAVGGLDERFFLYTEDVDLCASMRARGRQVIFVPEAEVLHLRGRSAGRNPLTERMRRQSQLAYYEKHLPRWVGPLRWYLRLTGRSVHA